MVAPDGKVEIDNFFRTQYKDEIAIFIATIDKIEADMEKEGRLVGLRNVGPSKQDKQFAAIAWSGSDDVAQYARRFLISAVARLDSVVETGNDPRLTAADYELFKRTCQRLSGGWNFFEANHLRRENVQLEMLLKKERANNKILSEGIQDLQVKLEQATSSRSPVTESNRAFQPPLAKT